jgi:hypothetical protein
VRLQILLDDVGAGHVARHQVGRELDALEGQAQRVGQRVDEQGLGQARHAFEQAVPAGEHGHQHLLDDIALADDYLGQLLADAAICLLTPLHGGDFVFGDSLVTHGCSVP